MDRHKKTETLNWTCECKTMNPLWNLHCRNCGCEIPIQIKILVYKEELAKQREQIVLPECEKHSQHVSDYNQILTRFEKYLTPILLGMGGLLTVLIFLTDTSTIAESIRRNFDTKIDRIVIGVQEIRDHFCLIKNIPSVVVDLFEKTGELIKR